MIQITDLKSLCGNGNEESLSSIMWMAFSAGVKTIHNYNIEFHRRTGVTGKTKGWILKIYQCLTASNSNEIPVLTTKYKTLKYCKSLAVSIINMWEEEAGNNTIYKYLSENRKPVFKIDSYGKPIIIGSTFYNLGSEIHSQRNNKSHSYYLCDVPLPVSFRNQKCYSISGGSLRGLENVFEYVSFSGSCYCHGYEDDISSLTIFNKSRLIKQVEFSFGWWCKNNPIEKKTYQSEKVESND